MLGKGKTGKVQWALSLFQKLYRIEKAIKGKTVDEIYRIRQEESKPLMKAYKDWLDKSVNQVPPKSILGKAITYSLNQLPKLIRYLEDGRLNIDNNRAERAVKPFVIDSEFRPLAIKIQCVALATEIRYLIKIVLSTETKITESLGINTYI